ncbi:ATP synthase A1 subunit C [Candidatus Woesearchaeota archaeon]|nr:ATP synthase A1 subunit C [Candidatus Woesearchaeota archaeon]
MATANINEKHAYRKMSIPYTFARVCAMRSKLIPRTEFLKLLKMELSAITRYLQESEYRDAITKLSSNYRGVELVDQALKLNQEQTFSKLRRISTDEVEKLINSYIARVDIQNLKVIIRGIYSNSKKEDIIPLVQPVGKLDEKYYEALFELNTIEKVLKENRIVEFKDISSAFEDFKRTNRLIELENTLDKHYYWKALQDAKSLPDKGKLYTKFLEREIDLLNIKNLLRLKREKTEPAKIMSYMIAGGRMLKKNVLTRLSTSDSLETLMSRLRKTRYGKAIAFVEGSSLVEIQLKIDRYLMKSAFLRTHQEPMSVICVLGYMMSKIIELKNLRLIVKAKYLGVPMDYIEKNMLI